MFINAGLGLLGIYTQIGWLLSLFGKRIGDYPVYVHVIPFLYFVLYTFLLRHSVMDITQSRDDPEKRNAWRTGMSPCPLRFMSSPIGWNGGETQI